MWLRLVALAAVVFLMVIPCSAYEDELSGLMDSLPSEISDSLPESFFGGVDEMSEGLEQVLESGFWKKLAADTLGIGISDSLDILLPLLGLILISALLSLLRDTFRSDALSSAAELAVSAVALGLLIKTATLQIGAVSAHLHRLNTLCLAMIPLMGTLLAMGGNARAAVVAHSGSMAVLGVTQIIIDKVFGVIAGVSIALLAADLFSSRFRLASVAAALRRLFGVFFTAITTLLGFMISLRLGLAAASDSMAMRGARLFASNAVPIVGSAVGESLRTVAASLSYVKSLSGSAGIVFILILTLPIFIKVWVFRSGLVLLSSAAEMLGCERERRLFSGIISLLGYLLAVVAVTAVIFILMLTLFLKIVPAFGGSI